MHRLSSRLRSSVHVLNKASFSMETPVPLAQPAGPLETRIREKLTAQFSPQALQISNDSWKHRHHAAMQAQGGGNGETHFSVQIVSEVFRAKTTMQRHRLIYAALKEELDAGLHALSLQTKTEEELAARSETGTGV
ncbi:bola-like protein-domain-containing protein [Mycena rosella]|uniref:Bola-like protein-domain-containing protein n=1 Tax=Mycena rosella TaxID=1033263 RepID=A0AAD7D7J1_MYCRO|nr:bola-like protein-domain-containing protein [Mycena rosella]